MSSGSNGPPAQPNDSEERILYSEPAKLDMSKLVFDEPESPANMVRDPQNPQQLTSATFAKLIEHLTHPTVHDPIFLDDFILTYGSFAAPLEVLEALSRRYDSAPETIKRDVGIRVFNVIEYWIENAYYDFYQDDALYKRCVTYLDNYISNNDPLKDMASGIKANMIQKKKNGRPANSVPKASTNPPPTLLGPQDNALSNLMDLNAEEIARQLTLIDFNIWARIQPCELLNRRWNKEDQLLTPNILDTLERFEVVGGWVATAIVTAGNLKKRAQVLGKCLEILNHLMAMGNLQGVKLFLVPLGWASPVHTLRQTWDCLTAEQKQEFEKLQLLEDDRAQKTHDKMHQIMKTLNPPVLPFLGLYLWKLHDLEENPDYVDRDNLIHWHRRHLTAEVIREIKHFQQTPYPFAPVEWLQNNLNTAPALNRGDLNQAAIWLEGIKKGKKRGPKPEVLTQAKKDRARAESAYAASIQPNASSSKPKGFFGSLFSKDK